MCWLTHNTWIYNMVMSRVQILILSKSFAMKDMELARQILGMHIVRDWTQKLLWLSQEKYVAKVLRSFSMADAKPFGSTLPTNYKLSGKQSPKTKVDKAEMMKIPYASTIGSLMYAMVRTQPDIRYAVGMVSRFMSNTGRDHWVAVKWILRYLTGTSSVCLRSGSGKPLLEGFTDSDILVDVDTSRSTFGYVRTYAGGSRIMAVATAVVCGTINHRSGVYGGCRSRQGSNLDEGLHRRARNLTGGISASLRQSKCHPP